MIGGYKVPRSYEFRADALPVTSVGKVRKNALRDHLAAHSEGGASGVTRADGAHRAGEQPGALGVFAVDAAGADGQTGLG